MIMSASGVFLLLAAVLLYSALRVITARNPVHAALFLLLAFFTAAGLWALITAEFLAIAIILIYVGAVMVLFLFVVMMLDINIDRLREGFWRQLPLAVTVAVIVFAEMCLVFLHRSFAAQNTVAASTVSNVRALGELLFSDYMLPFEAASFVLLVAMIAAIVLTQRGRKPSRQSNPADQVRVRAADRLRIVDMPSSKPSSLTEGDGS